MFAIKAASAGVYMLLQRPLSSGKKISRAMVGGGYFSSICIIFSDERDAFYKINRAVVGICKGYFSSIWIVFSDDKGAFYKKISRAVGICKGYFQ